MNIREYLQAYHGQLAISRSMQVRREEYLDYMTFQANERPLFTEIFGPLLGLRDEWAAQGASPEELDHSAFRYRQPMWGAIPVRTGWMGGAEPTLLEETADLLFYRDQMGRRMQLSKNAATLALPMTYPVKDMDDWLRVKPHYQFSEDRFTPGWEEVARTHQVAGRVVTVSIPGAFDEPRQLMGEENLCLAYYDQPELVHDMMATFRGTALQVLDRVAAAVQVDELHIHEDMAGKAGPLIGPKQVEEFIVPYTRPIWEMLASYGARLFRQDSDGNMMAVIPTFLESGINFMYPMEPAAGMDMVSIREQYGERLAIMGGIDKHILRGSFEEIEAEMEYKIPPMVRSGGCILALDHRIPNGTPLAAYRFYIKKAWEIMERESYV